MATDKIEGYVIKVQKYKEKDSIITLLTSNGIKTIYGRGYKNIKSKYHILNNIFLKLYMYGDEKKYFILKDFEVIEYPKIKYDNYTYISYLYKIIDIILRNDNKAEQEKFYRCFEYMLNRINEKNYEQVFYWYIAKILKFNNVNLEFKKCVICGNEKEFKTFSILDGGLICNNCYTNQEIKSIEEIKKINLIFNGKIEKIEKMNISLKLKTEIENLLDETLGIQIRR